MADAILSRGGTSVTVPLDVTDNSLAVARDAGKPNASESAVGAQAPKPADHLNPQIGITIAGTLTGPSAHADAKKLAEDLILPQATDQTPLQLDLSAVAGLSTYDVAPITDSALTLTYDAGVTDRVGVDLSVTEVATTRSGENQGSFSANTAGSGSGVDLSLRGGKTTTLPEGGLTLTRSCGRPGGQLVAQPADTGPVFFDQNKPAVDEWEFTAEFTGATAGTTAAELVDDVIATRTGYDVYDLDFKSLWGLDSYPVFPLGSAPVRTARHAGSADERVRVPSLRLRTTTQYVPEQ